MHFWIDLGTVGGYRALLDELHEDYGGDLVVSHLQGALTVDVKGLVVETGYVDKDYRSTYYSFYAKKGMRYSAACVRLHFFREGITLDEVGDFRCIQGRPQDHYVGYMVLRPTASAPIGRTVLSVRARESVQGGVIQANHHVHLLGERFDVEGFPYMQQHSDISVCAHAACWSILRHYTQKHRCYAEFLVTDITTMASPTDPGGLLPSRGLNLEQVARVFSLAGLFPDTYLKEDTVDRQGKKDPVAFYRHLNAYIESGLPVFAAMTALQHAITVVGQGLVKTDAFDNTSDSLLFEWDAVEALIVVDDNHMPYMTIDTLNSKHYKVGDIDAFIVPLPEKIYLPAEAAEAQIVDVLENGYVSDTVNVQQLDFSFMDRPVIRYFLTTSSSFKAFARTNQSAYPAELFQTLMDLTLPQFVWVAQVADLEEWKQQRSSVTFLLDATASASDVDPFFMLHDQHRAFVHDRGDTRRKGWISFQQLLAPGPKFLRNLTYRS